MLVRVGRLYKDKLFHSLCRPLPWSYSPLLPVSWSLIFLAQAGDISAARQEVRRAINYLGEVIQCDGFLVGLGPTLRGNLTLCWESEMVRDAVVNSLLSLFLSCLQAPVRDPRTEKITSVTMN